MNAEARIPAEMAEVDLEFHRVAIAECNASIERTDRLIGRLREQMQRRLMERERIASTRADHLEALAAPRFFSPVPRGRHIDYSTTQLPAGEDPATLK